MARFARPRRLNIGARLVAYDGAGSIVRLEKAGRRFLDDLGLELDLGVDAFGRISRCGSANRMAQALFDALTDGKAAMG